MLQTLTIESVPAQVDAAVGSKARPATNDVEPVDDEDDEFLDPITKEVIVDPVIGSDGITYDRCAPFLGWTALEKRDHS